MAVKALSPNHCTARELPKIFFLLENGSGQQILLVFTWQNKLATLYH